MIIGYWIGISVLVLVGFYLFDKWNRSPVDWNPKDVAELLESWINNDIDYQGWDYFEACKISDPKLEAIRKRAIEATWIESPYIVSCGTKNEHLNEEGKKLFKELRERCLEI